MAHRDRDGDILPTEQCNGALLQLLLTNNFPHSLLQNSFEIVTLGMWS